MNNEVEAQLRTALDAAAESTPMSSDDAAWNRVVETIDPNRRSHSSSWPIGLAAAAVAVVIAGFAALGGNDEITTIDVADTISKVTTQDSLPIETGDDTEIEAALCRGRAAEMQTAVADPVLKSFTERSSDVEVQTLRFRHDDVTRIVLIAGDDVIGCDFQSGADGGPEITSFMTGTATEPEPITMTVAIREWESFSDDGETGPGTATLVGRASSEVESVTMELADGTLVEALFDQGWFSIRADVADGVDIFDQRIIVNNTPSGPDTMTTPARLDRSGIEWFTDDGNEGLVGDDGNSFALADGSFVTTAARLPNGDIYFIRNEQLMVLRHGSSQVELGEIDSAVLEVSRTAEGEVVWRDDTFQPRLLSGDIVIQDVNTGRTMTASNGYSVTVTDAVIDEEDRGWVTGVLEPARVEISDESGQLLGTLDISGASATFVRVTDFDGRRIVIQRQPQEPAQGPFQTLIVDLECGDGCVETTLVNGITVLNGPDISTSPSISLETFAICDNSDTEPASPPSSMTADAAETYAYLVLGVQSCDPFIQPGPEVPFNEMSAALATSPIVQEGSFLFVNDRTGLTVTIDQTGVYQVDR